MPFPLCKHCEKNKIYDDAPMCFDCMEQSIITSRKTKLFVPRKGAGVMRRDVLDRAPKSAWIDNGDKIDLDVDRGMLGYSMTEKPIIYKEETPLEDESDV